MVVVEDLFKALVGSYFLAAGILFVFQRKLQYLPSAQRPPHPRRLSKHFESIQEISTLTEDGIELHGWHWPALEGGRHSKVSVLHFHGNAGNREHRLRWAYVLRLRLGCSITLLDYRGYGGNPGYPSEIGLILDALAGLRWLCSANVPGDVKLVIHLESIGSVAGINALSKLAPERRHLISGIVIEGGLSSCIEIAQERLRVFPLSILMLDKWSKTCSSARAIPRQTHVLSLHGVRDKIVPVKFGQKLFDAITCEQKQFVQFSGGGHNDLLDQPSYIQNLDVFYSQL